MYLKQFRSSSTFEDHGEANALKWLQHWHQPSSEEPKTNSLLSKPSNGLLMVPNTWNVLTLLKDKTIFIIAIAIWFSTTSMSVLEPTLPIWLIEKIDPPVGY